MPVYTEVATSQRELRVQPTYARPLPDLSAASVVVPERHYDVVIVGAGPTGLLATLLLSRYGVNEARLLCIDSKPGSLRSGQADGVQPRTMEVLASLGLHREILDEGCQFWELAFWNSAPGGGIKRASYAPDVSVPSSYPHETTIHQGRIERILDEDLKRYSSRGVERSTTMKAFRLDEPGDHEFPILIEVEKGDTSERPQALLPGKHLLRCKHLIGADGAHSTVRKASGIPLTGESRDYIWGVIDFLADTKFPDIRRKAMVQGEVGSCMVIPRERIATGEYLSRIYVHMEETEAEEVLAQEFSAEVARRTAKEKRGRVTAERILEQADRVLQPYGIKMREGSVPDWWAAYEIGQRMCERFIKRDSAGTPRVFLAGDACHTHSPKAGQGMNVSMMDAYNLSWKLAHFLLGITPEDHALELLESYESERRNVARELIEYDHALSTAFSGSRASEDITTKNGSSDLSAKQLDEVWRVGHGFTSGCGIEYHESGLVHQAADAAVEGDAYLYGILRPGRRILNVLLQRHADGRPTGLHEELPSVGRFSLLILTSSDLLHQQGSSAQAIAYTSQLVRRYVRGVLHPVILHALLEDIKGIDWGVLPPGIHEEAEMSFYCGKGGQLPLGKEGSRFGTWRKTEDAYTIYGVSKTRGAIVVIRPDQVVGMVAGLTEGARVQKYLDRWLHCV